MAFGNPERRTSPSKGPDYMAKSDTRDYVSGKKKLKSETDYKPAAEDDRARCFECKNYVRKGQEKSDCKKVVGLVQHDGVCDLFLER